MIFFPTGKVHIFCLSFVVFITFTYVNIMFIFAKMRGLFLCRITEQIDVENKNCSQFTEYRNGKMGFGEHPDNYGRLPQHSRSE